MKATKLDYSSEPYCKPSFWLVQTVWADVRSPEKSDCGYFEDFRGEGDFG